MKFFPGDRVLCIDARPTGYGVVGGFIYIKAGEIYTVSETHCCRVNTYLGLIEFPNGNKRFRCVDCHGRADWFRYFAWRFIKPPSAEDFQHEQDEQESANDPIFYVTPKREHA